MYGDGEEKQWEDIGPLQAAGSNYDHWGTWAAGCKDRTRVTQFEIEW